MRELVGICLACGQPVYCEDGFFNGSIQEDGGILCFKCVNREDEGREA